MRGWLTVSLVLMAAGSAADVVQDAGGNSCLAYEYPIQVWSSETRRYNEVFGMNRFARQDQCEQARLAEQAASDAIIGYVLRAAPKARLQKWNFLECRCDRTRDASSPAFLDERRREAFVRIYEAGRYDIWEEALDKKLSEQNEIARQFHATRRDSLPSGAWPLVVAVPEESEERLLNPTATRLKPTSVQVTAATGPVLDHLQLVEVDFGDLDLPYTIETIDGAERTSIAFIERQIGRVQSLLPQTFEVADDAVRDELIEVFQQRLQLLSNLDRIIGSAPPSSALVLEATSAASPADDEALIRSFFGAEVSEHWTPPNLEDALVELPTRVADDPLAVLRSTDTVDPSLRGLALYAYLMRTPTLTENEEIWMASLLDATVREN